MLADSLVLTDNVYGAGPAKTFVKVSDDVNGSLRIDNATELDAPRHLAIRHSAQKAKDGRVTDRHLIQVTDTATDANGVSSVVTVNLTIAYPRNGQSLVNVQLALAQLVDVFMLNGGSVSDRTERLKALLRNER